MTDARRFYTERIPAQFNAALDAQAALGEAGRRVYEGMAAVNATLQVDVRGEGGGAFFLNIHDGRMTSEEAPAHPPFLTLIQDVAAFERLAAEAGDSALALLGGLSGLAGELKLTKQRVDLLAGLRGAVRFEVLGEDGFALVTHFGPEPVPSEPHASIRVDPDVYRELRGGGVDPAQAFLDGKLRVEGDMQLTMQLALAAIAPD
jgi:SCP-2 sterol transfer family